jgi:osmoprotectant transport system ATP-binding protein
MIEIDRVVKEYAGRRVVDEISLRIETGELCVLLGTSGSGKSTLLKMINRQIALTQGAIRIGGEDIARLPIEPLRRRIGYAIQSIGLFPHWTIEANIATVPRLLKWSRARIADRVTELLELLQLPPEIYRHQYPHQLSGGQQQRVGVARALAADPDVLLMDEPFGALDPITREALQAALARIHKATGKTIVFVTHDIDEALKLADRIAILDAGRLVQHATPRELLEHPANDFVRDFVGRSEIGLKQLSVVTVAERMHTDDTAPGAPIAAAAPLREALAEMILRRTDRLPVAASDGRALGVVRLADLIDRRGDAERSVP